MNCKICLSSSFEGDAALIRLEDFDQDNLSQLVSPCNCKGTVALIHLGCHMIDTALRNSEQCSLCSCKFRRVKTCHPTTRTLLFRYIKSKRKFISNLLLKWLSYYVLYILAIAVLVNFKLGSNWPLTILIAFFVLFLSNATSNSWGEFANWANTSKHPLQYYLT